MALIAPTSSTIPSTDEIETALRLLSHPSLQILRRSEEGFELTTSSENATAVLVSISALLAETGGQWLPDREVMRRAAGGEASTRVVASCEAGPTVSPDSNPVGGFRGERADITNAMGPEPTGRRR